MLLFVDEVGAIVFDIGAHSVRAGYAGEDCPKVIHSDFCIFMCGVGIRGKHLQANTGKSVDFL